MNNVAEKINLILAEWDPINVGKSIALDEYMSYVPIIIKHINNKTELIFCLEDILINKLEAGYDSNNIEQRIDVERIVDKIISINKG